MSNKCLVGHLNIQSLVPKLDELQQYMSRQKFDIFAVSESWLTERISSDNIMIDGYTVFRKDRYIGRGSGVLFYISNRFKCEVIDVSDDIEQLFIKVVFRKCVFVIGVVYKPPLVNYKHFIDSLETSLTIAAAYSENIICIGDVNVNFLDNNCLPTIYFNSMLNSLEMSQMITEPTRITLQSESLIDVLLSNCNTLVETTFVDSVSFSDHDCVCGILNCEKPTIEPKIITYRDFKNFNEDEFINDLNNANLDSIFYIYDIDEKVNSFCEMLLRIFDKHIPLKTVKVTKKRAPWLNNEIKSMMSDRDRAKAKLRKHRTEETWNEYKRLKNLVNHKVSYLKNSYFNNILRNKTNKDLWKELKSLSVHNKAQCNIENQFGDANVALENSGTLIALSYMFNCCLKFVDNVDDCRYFHYYYTSMIITVSPTPVILTVHLKKHVVHRREKQREAERKMLHITEVAVLFESLYLLEKPSLFIQILNTASVESLHGTVKARMYLLTFVSASGEKKLRSGERVDSDCTHELFYRGSSIRRNDPGNARKKVKDGVGYRYSDSCQGTK
nr:unnamed protein product [Callosobruchus chinensis]